MSLIYFDHNATSPPSRAHYEAVVERLMGCGGNPSSPHALGRRSHVALTTSRRAVAASLGVEPADIIFVSGGTEANNLGTVGVLGLSPHFPRNVHAIYSAVEHPAVREPLEYLSQNDGLLVTRIPVDTWGFVSLETILSSVTKKTALITIMAVNNEVGSIQPVFRLGEFLHYKRWGIASNEADKQDFEALSAHCDPQLTKEDWQKNSFSCGWGSVLRKIAFSGMVFGRSRFLCIKRS